LGARWVVLIYFLIVQNKRKLIVIKNNRSFFLWFKMNSFITMHKSKPKHKHHVPWKIA
jgi:hypothetical protein